jgi:hypothetical protein
MTHDRGRDSGVRAMAKTRKKVTHPWVAVGTICENLLEDKDGVLSVIRMVDRFNVPKPPAEWDGKNPLHLPLKGVVGFRSGDVKGKRTIRIFGTSPRGKRTKLYELEVEFLGKDIGVQIKVNILFGFVTEGTHWLDVYVEKWLATRIPVTIVFESTNTQEGKNPAQKK